MKKLFAIIAFLGLFTLGISNAAMAQDEAAPQTEQAADQSATEGGLHKALKTKYIEGKNDTALLSESSLKKDWMLPEEEKAWEDL